MRRWVCQKWAPGAWISNHGLDLSVGCDYLSMPYIVEASTQVSNVGLLLLEPSNFWPVHHDGFVQWKMRKLSIWCSNHCLRGISWCLTLWQHSVTPLMIMTKTLTHWGRDKMVAISQTTLWNASSWMEILEFWLKFHWSLFLRVQLTIFQHWFR